MVSPGNQKAFIATGIITSVKIPQKLTLKENFKAIVSLLICISSIIKSFEKVYYSISQPPNSQIHTGYFHNFLFKRNCLTRLRWAGGGMDG
jgi:hypothetical protein